MHIRAVRVNVIFIIIVSIIIMRLSMLAPTPPHPRQGGEFSLFGMTGLPQGSGSAHAKHTQRVSSQDLNSNVARWAGQLNSN